MLDKTRKGVFNGKGEFFKIVQEFYEISTLVNNNFLNFQQERTLIF